MKRSYTTSTRTLALTIFSVTFLFMKSLAQPGSWTEKQPLGNLDPNPKVSLSFSLQNKGYIITADTNGVQRQLWQFDPATERWLRKADFPGAGRFGALGLAIGEKAYVGLGIPHGGDFGTGFLKDFWEYDPVRDTWTRKADLPGLGRYGAAGFTLNNKGYVGTGDSHLGVLSDFWEYDPALDKWTRRNDVPGGNRYNGMGMAIGNKGYLGLGQTAAGITGVNDFWQYTPETDTWVRKADYAGNGRMGTASFSLNNKGYVGGGFGISTGDFYHNDFWEYDPVSDMWIKKENIPGIGRAGFLAFALNNTGYVGSGTIGFNVSYTSEEVYKYDATTDDWTESGRLGKTGRWGAVAFSIGNKGYITTGSEAQYNLTHLQNDLWEFDPIINRWTEKAAFPGEPRVNAISFMIGNKAYVGLGYTANGIRKSDLWCYDPVPNSWERKADLPAPGRESAVAFSIGSKGYVGTGFTSELVNNQVNSSYLRDFWEYDPILNTWTKKADLPGVERRDAISFSVGSKGYIGLGTTSGAAAANPSDVWEYDPLQNTWLRKADFPEGTRESAVGFSVDNNGYVALGRSDDGSARKDVWEFNPSSNTWTRKTDFGGEARHEAVAFTIGDKAYVGTGVTSAFVPDLWEFDPDNTSPVANAWLMKYYTPNSVLLNAWGSGDPDGGPITYSWQKIAGPDGFTMWYDNSATPYIFNMPAGKYTFRVTITDSNGATASSDVTFDVKSNQPPVANGWLMQYYSPTSVLMNAWGSYDPEGGPITFSWRQIDGPSTATIWYANASTPHIFNMVTGIYSFELTVTDDQGATDRDTVDVPINNPTTVASSRDLNQVNTLNASLLKVFPNPVKENLNFSWSSDYLGKAKLTVMDMSGRVVLSTDLQKGVPELIKTVPLPSLRTGVYYLHITTGKGKPITTQFLKE